MYIDCHAHLRDFNEAQKETIAHALRVAEDSGLSAIFDMSGANGNPPGINLKTIEARLRRAKDCNSPVFYGCWVGLTADPKQIEQAIQIHNLYFPKPGDKVGVIGLKYFAGKSIGPLSTVDYESQRIIYGALATQRFNGVLAVHCEKESEMKPALWNPNKPSSHALARPEESEIDSIVDQIWLAQSEGYEGHLHICHVSTPESVDLVNNQKEDMRISCGVTPHHLLLDYEVMNGENGMLYKVNPPLRSPATREKLFKKFLDGEIDILETDHAPHTLDEKTEKYMSGIPGLASWPDFVKLLLSKGASPYRINDMAYSNINHVFGTNITEVNERVKPGAHLKEYAFDAYHDLKEADKE